MSAVLGVLTLFAAVQEPAEEEAQRHPGAFIGVRGHLRGVHVLVFFILALMPLVFKLTDRLTVKKDKKA